MRYVYFLQIFYSLNFERHLSFSPLVNYLIILTIHYFDTYAFIPFN